MFGCFRIENKKWIPMPSGIRRTFRLWSSIPSPHPLFCVEFTSPLKRTRGPKLHLTRSPEVASPLLFVCADDVPSLPQQRRRPLLFSLTSGGASSSSWSPATALPSSSSSLQWWRLFFFLVSGGDPSSFFAPSAAALFSSSSSAVEASPPQLPLCP
jgi:hypothetical protein